MKQCKKNHRNKLTISHLLALIVIACIFVGFSYYSIFYAITIIQWESDGLQKHSGYCIGYDTRYISTSRKMFIFRLENGDTVEMSSTLLHETSFDESEFIKLVENQTPIEVTYTKCYNPVIGIFTKTYGLVSINAGKEVIVSDSIMHRELLGSAVLYGFLALALLMIPTIHLFLPKTSITNKQSHAKRKRRKNSRRRN